VEIRDFALTILTSEDLVIKLEPPRGELTDDSPRVIEVPESPARGERLRFAPVDVPSIEGFHDPRQRRRIVHALANHELQAAELFALALLRFPGSPPEFRRGLLRVLVDEQRHTRMYLARLADLGVALGDFPVNGYFWSKVPQLTTPLRFLCAMSLTFENANLDHTIDYAAAARQAGDAKSAALIDVIHRDEIEHVRFGWTWLQVFKERDQSAWESYQSNLTWPLRPLRARGRSFDREGRKAAGLDEEFIRRLQESEP
jgi:uncharacterized ferritin-like protein (DUF455 family)